MRGRFGVSQNDLPNVSPDTAADPTPFRTTSSVGQSGWWKVEASLIVRASTEDKAIDQAAEAIRTGYNNVRGVLPVGTFRAQPHRDHVTDALDAKEAAADAES